jgi:exopolyphosphatase
VHKYIVPVTNIPSSELRLRPELKALLKHAELEPTDLINLDDLGSLQERLTPEKTGWTLVDHNVFQGDLGSHYSNQVTGVIDHHTDEGQVPKEAKPRVVEKTGSCISHVVEYCRGAWDAISRSSSTDDAASEDENDVSTWDAQVAKLALGPILIDTVNLKATDKVTDHDRNAVTYLESKISASSTVGPTYDRDAFFYEINSAKSDIDDLSLEEILRKDYKQWTEDDLNLGISCVVRPIQYLKSKTEDLVSALVDFAKGRGVQLFAVMTAHNDSGQFERQLLLLVLQDGEPLKIADKFVKTNLEELQLEERDEELDASQAKWIRMWEQKNLTASRKRLAPLMRESMK